MKSLFLPSLFAIIFLGSCSTQKRLYKAEAKSTRILLLEKKMDIDNGKTLLSKISPRTKSTNATGLPTEAAPVFIGDTILTFASWVADRDFTINNLQRYIDLETKIKSGANTGFLSLSLGGLVVGAAGGIYGTSNNNKVASYTSIITGLLSGALALFNFDKNRQDAEGCLIGLNTAQKQFTFDWTDAFYPKTVAALQKYTQAKAALIAQLQQPTCGGVASDDPSVASSGADSTTPPSNK